MQHGDWGEASGIDENLRHGQRCLKGGEHGLLTRGVFDGSWSVRSRGWN